MYLDTDRFLKKGVPSGFRSVDSLRLHAISLLHFLHTSVKRIAVQIRNSAKYVRFLSQGTVACGAHRFMLNVLPG